ncbi:ABC transporter ATP-binding protein [Lachnoanaerobaculum sp. Marseille-Q4761]|uniref:ABC transporter ATP-binding protein n=1 Tax=Lachnoanaerobaculum sp. Marseille-Q4761 TaxID=2819511 RepID=UPI001AA137DC|nr:ABC transporter ATP-binding protein [Lachnoanaerobaculum sp. Marseille-Q4761]MBO1871464.1 ABC transporter ATP-binding protein [Lachnoanaerobaculum sp. Marseille-Q4761]
MVKEAIKTVNLSKKYGKTLVVNDLNLSISSGEIVGFLGLNGAGKTTTMRMLLGLIKPTSGECYIQGNKIDQYNVEVLNEIGYIIETPYSYPDLTVQENLEIVSTLRGIRNKDVIDWVTEKLKLDQYKDKQVKHLSLGNIARLGIAKAIIHKPEILILDEPTNGLDPFGVIEVRELLKELANNLGTTVLISSHKLEEISKVATRIVIIHEGRLIREVESKELDLYLEKRLLVSGRNNKAMKEVLSAKGYQVNFKSDLENNSCYLELIDTKSVESSEEIATLLVNAGYPPKMLTVEKEDLENYFLRVLNDCNRGA